MDPKPKRQPVPAGGQPTPDAIAAADTTPPTETPSEESKAADTTPPAETPSEESQAADNTDAPADDGELVEARVLVAFDEYDANQIFLASAAEVERRKLAGTVDPHPDAVAYAKSLLGA